MMERWQLSDRTQPALPRRIGGLSRSDLASPGLAVGFPLARVTVAFDNRGTARATSTGTEP